MKNEITRGRGTLRDTGPAGGIYDVDYIIHRFAKNTINIKYEQATHQMVTVQIVSVNGYSLKNGTYMLDHEAGTLQLRKLGPNWELINEDEARGDA